jgi:tRNA U34 5-carboxymethylaminomethyl modifying GTPase MnmE/TrmE
MPEKREKISPEKTLEIQKKIIENLVELQKVHSNLAEKFDKLAHQISNLLSLFESAARTFAEQAPATSTEKDKEFLDKIDRLLDQNKTIAKGLTLMDEKMRERIYGQPAMPKSTNEEARRPVGARPLPRI